MGQKQIVTRTQIAKMAGTDVTHFLNQRACFAAKSLGDQAGLQNVGGSPDQFASWCRGVGISSSFMCRLMYLHS